MADRAEIEGLCRAVADTGRGVIGINSLSFMLADTGRSTVEDFVAHIETVVDLVDAAASETQVLDILIKAIQLRMKPGRLLAEVERRNRVRHRGFVLRVLEVTDEGVESHLELEYRKRVEHAHGLPRSVKTDTGNRATCESGDGGGR